MPGHTPNFNSGLTVGSVSEKAISSKKLYYTLDLVRLPVMNFHGVCVCSSPETYAELIAQITGSLLDFQGFVGSWGGNWTITGQLN